MIKLTNIVKEIQGDYKIYCDLDGVLADFNGQFERLFGMPPDDYEKEYGTPKFWKMISSHGMNYWSDMPMMFDARKLWNEIKRQDPIILTAIPEDGAVAAQGKKIWVARNLGQNVKVIVTKARLKQQYASPNSILIDDKEKNINEWRMAGGIGILHKNANSTIAQLNRLK